jgi:hypothetical protein
MEIKADQKPAAVARFLRSRLPDSVLEIAIVVVKRTSPRSSVAHEENRKHIGEKI